MENFVKRLKDIVDKKLKKSRVNLKIGEYFLAIDIGTEMLKGILAKITETGIEVIKYSKIWQQHRAMRSGIITDLDMVIQNLTLLYNDLKTDVIVPTKVILSIAGDLVKGETVIVNFERTQNANVEISSKEETAIIKNTREKVIDNAVKEFMSQNNLQPEDVIPLHVELVSSEIGGMKVNHLTGYKGHSIKLYFSITVAYYTYVEALLKVAQSLNLDIITVVSQPFAVAKAYLNGKDDVNAVFIDIGGGTTDVALVKEGHVVNFESFSFGGRIFTERIAKEMNLDYRHAEMRKIKYALGKLDKAIASKVKPLLEGDVKLWVHATRIAFTKIHEDGDFPSQFYLCGGGSLLPELKESMLVYRWKNYLPVLSHPKIEVIKPSALIGVIDKTGRLNSSIEVTPVAVAWYAWSIYKNPANHLSLKY